MGLYKAIFVMAKRVHDGSNPLVKEVKRKCVMKRVHEAFYKSTSDESSSNCAVLIDVAKIPVAVLQTLYNCLRDGRLHQCNGQSVSMIRRYRITVSEWFQQIKVDGIITGKLAMKLQMALERQVLMKLGIHNIVQRAFSSLIT